MSGRSYAMQVSGIRSELRDNTLDQQFTRSLFESNRVLALAAGLRQLVSAFWPCGLRLSVRHFAPCQVLPFRPRLAAPEGPLAVVRSDSRDGAPERLPESGGRGPDRADKAPLKAPCRQA